MRAMILAAGRGERMRPLTDTTPKPLLPVGGKPLIVWHIERLVESGIRDIIINHAWLGYLIEAALQDGQRYGARITYSAEPQALETAGGIARALDFFQDQPFLVVNGDIWCDWNPAEALQQGKMLERDEKLAWLLLVANPEHHAAGDFLLSPANNVYDSPSSQGADALTFAGIGVYRPALFQSLDKAKAVRLAPLLRQAMAKNQVAGRFYDGIWIDVGTPQRLSALDRMLAG
ncbi:nucleotidyltransferase family protein [Paralcaligenes sp. KSB-10]|uniref:N-acetylmuramate alpha-1-phosphate uridylyltransferase MurU n=1 Tax=Paralcaligenes sp. KSB-10 TaxID=2901142 RepID=UPI001E4253E0|nr:nucleotidyltransferase family protein [Paralcaligenes sp. KSB-10]UHL65795.1 nucleotidyltransferase family protein [Paralcaligenes sp. KSB-10]